MRLSGIFSTPLCSLLARAGFSPEIGGQAREGDTHVEHLPSHRGVAVTGPARDAVADALRDRLGALVPTDYVEMGNIYRGEVLHLLNEGAILDLDACEGYLPYKFTHQGLEQGDRIIVQVVDVPHEPLRPIVSQTISVPGRHLVFSSVTDVTVADGVEPERRDVLIQLAETLRPPSWGIHWRREAGEASATVLEREVLERRALLGRLERLMEEDREVGLLYSPRDFLEVLLPSEALGALDALRATEAPTLPFHYYLSSLGHEAAFAVEVLEGLGQAAGTAGERASAEVLRRALAPIAPGASVEVEQRSLSGKRLAWQMDVRSFDGTDLVLVGPTPVGDTGVAEMRRGAWTFPTIYFDEAGRELFRNHTVCTPLELRPSGASYVSFGIAVVQRGKAREVVNEESLDAALADGVLSEALAARARQVARELARELAAGGAPDGKARGAAARGGTAAKRAAAAPRRAPSRPVGRKGKRAGAGARPHG